MDKLAFDTDSIHDKISCKLIVFVTDRFLISTHLEIKCLFENLNLTFIGIYILKLNTHDAIKSFNNINIR